MPLDDDSASPAAPMPASWRDLIAVHPAADLFPMMGEAELRELGEDIEKNGLQHSIVLWTPEPQPGTRRYKKHKEIFVIDGRNRLEAVWRSFPALEDREDPEGRVYAVDWMLDYGNNGDGVRVVYGDTDPWKFVVSANIRRRHLTGEQKRELVAKLLIEQPQRSDRATAALAGVSPTTVGTVRHELEEAGDVSKLDTRTDSIGREQPATKPEPVQVAAAPVAEPVPQTAPPPPWLRPEAEALATPQRQPWQPTPWRPRRQSRLSPEERAARLEARQQARWEEQRAQGEAKSATFDRAVEIVLEALSDEQLVEFFACLDVAANHGSHLHWGIAFRRPDLFPDFDNEDEDEPPVAAGAGP